MQVIPSIDVDDISAFSEQIRRLVPHYDRFQIDIADGALVPFKSVSLEDALSALNAFTTIQIDLHLMVADPLSQLNQIEDSLTISQVKVVFIHHKIKPEPSLFTNIEHPYELGLVLNPEDQVDTIQQLYDLENIKNIQIMSVDSGPQGSPFKPDSLNKIEQLRDLDYKNKIFLDGGINEKSLKTILKKKFLPDFICPGSFFSRAENVKDRVQYLSNTLTHENNSNQNP